MLDLKDIMSVSERLETPFLSEKYRFGAEKLKYAKYLDMYKPLKRGSRGLESWLVATPYLSFVEQMILIGSPIETIRRRWHRPGHLVFGCLFSGKPSLRKVFRKIN